MSEKEKERKAFNTCADALSELNPKNVMKVFRLLSVHFDVVPSIQEEPAIYSHIEDNSTSPEISDEKEPILIPEDNKITAKGKKKSSKKKILKQPNYLADYNFRPTSEISLKEFYENYNAKSNMEKNLLFTYYLSKKRGQKNIDCDYIFSCYRHLGIKIPSFPQTLYDTGYHKGWINTSSIDDIQVTTAGINYFEHDMETNG